MNPTVIDTSKLYTPEGLLAALFHEDCRPCVATLKRWQRRRIIPYYRIGNRCFYDLPRVREKLAAKNLIRAI